MICGESVRVYAREGDSFFALDALVSAFRNDTSEKGGAGVAKPALVDRASSNLRHHIVPAKLAAQASASCKLKAASEPP